MADDTSFMGGLMQGLSSAPTNPLVNFGLGLMSAAKPFGNVGDSMMQANQATLANQTAQQQLNMNRLNMQMTQAKLPGMQAYYQALQGLLNPQGGSPNQPTQSPMPGSMSAPAPPPSIALNSPNAPMPGQMPMPSQSGPSMPGGPQMGQAPMPQGLGIDPDAALRIGTMGAAYGMPGAEQLAKYPESLTAVQKAIQTQRQMATQGPMAALDTIATAPNADKIIQSNPQLKAHWAQVAPQLGFDPDKDLNSENAQSYARFAYNQMAGGAGLPTKEMPHPLKTVQLSDGRTAQVDPGDNKMTILPTDELQQVVGPNGTPILVSKAKAAGMTPFNATVFGAGQISDQSKEMAYQQWKATGSLPQGLARNPIMNANMMNFIAKRADQDGIPGVQAAATHQQYQAQQGVVNDFTKGKTAQTLNGLNTSVQHMDLLPPLIDNLKGGNMTILNKAQNFFKQQTGDPAPTSYAAIKEFVGGEVAKAVLPGGGGEAERQALTQPLNDANSPAQLKDAVATIQKALAGKTEALRNQWDVGTNGTQGSFDKFLLPATKKALGISTQPDRPGQHPPDIANLLDKYK